MSSSARRASSRPSRIAKRIRPSRSRASNPCASISDWSAARAVPTSPRWNPRTTPWRPETSISRTPASAQISATTAASGWFVIRPEIQCPSA